MTTPRSAWVGGSEIHLEELRELFDDGGIAFDAGLAQRDGPVGRKQAGGESEHRARLGIQDGVGGAAGLVGAALVRAGGVGRVRADLDITDADAVAATLDALQPDPALIPSDPKQRGRALWYEEYADTKLIETVGPVFFENVVKKQIMKAEPDTDRVAKVVAEDVPPVFDYLEGEVPESGDGIVGGRFSIADIALGSALMNARHGGLEIDASRWPRLAAYAAAVHGNPHFKPIIEEELAQFAG